MAKQDVIGYAPCPDPNCKNMAEVRVRRTKSGPGNIYIIHDYSPPQRGCGSSQNLTNWDQHTASDWPGFVPLAKKPEPKAPIPKETKPQEPESNAANPKETKPKVSLARRIWDGGDDD
ncbi:hypothetical protein [Hwanghaeella sp. LZ110]|uniref:hypothetical protein n=1 Tax=Hwanghaeella sp. LZ110 TaxID=3402810 RepID=UPI003B66CC62